jgi:hypothetical protein
MEISSDILIDAKCLRNNNVQKRQIKEILVDILKRIDEELKTAHQEGRNSLMTELPLIFGISNMLEREAQRVIWYKVIEFLKNKNYIISINPREDTCLLKITWFSKEDFAEIKHQNDVIAMHTKPL